MSFSEVKMNRNYWLKDGKYLPAFMRDFHDQKDLFKSIHGFLNIEKNNIAKNVDWITGQCYVIDVFLWFMGLHGYTLQKNKSKVDFLKIEDTLKEQYDFRSREFNDFLKSVIIKDESLKD